MRQILLKFAIDLRHAEIEKNHRMIGPGFHRFLPNGIHNCLEKDMIQLNGKIRFWFEQRGTLQDGFIKYDSRIVLKEKDVIQRQSLLNGGHIYGAIHSEVISEELFEVLQNNRIGDSSYVKFGKKVVEEIQEHSYVIIDILRDLYRQYWICKPDKWDSRTEPLGHFCKDKLYLKYSLDLGKTWNDFVPNEGDHIIMLTSIVNSDYSDFISEDDWSLITELFNSNYKPSIVSTFLRQTHETKDNGDLKNAFIEGATTLEIAIEHKINTNPQITKIVKDSIQSYKSLPLKSQFGILALECMDLKSEEIENSINAINIRNKIVHEGYEPKDSETKFLRSLLTAISKIIREPVNKFPTNYGSNSMIGDV